MSRVLHQMFNLLYSETGNSRPRLHRVERKSIDFSIGGLQGEYVIQKLWIDTKQRYVT